MHRRRKRDIVIELTALLDVIMIMIFMVMNENSKLTSETQAKYEATQQENIEQSKEIDDLTAQLAEALGKLEEGDLEELLERLQNAESRLDGYQSMDEVVTVLDVKLENQYNNTVRRLTFGVSDNRENIAIHDDSEFKAATNKLKVFIADYARQIADNSDAPTDVYIVFSYDPNKIYQRDFEAIDSILNSVASDANFQYEAVRILLTT